MNPKTYKIVSVLLVLIVIANFVLFSFTKIKPAVFWVVIALIALASYQLPKLKS